MFFLWNSPIQTFVGFSVPGVYTVVADHFEPFFGDVLYEALHKLKSRNGFFDVFVIFVPVVVKRDHFAVVVINAFCCDDRPSEIAPDVFGYGFWIALVWFGVYIESVFVIPVYSGFYRFERGTYVGLHLVQKSGTEGISKKSVVEMCHLTPGCYISCSAFGDKTVDMWIPLKTSSESVQYTDESRGEVFGFVHLGEHAENDAACGREETVEHFSVLKKKVS